MLQRLITLVSKVDGIFKSGLVTLNFNIVAAKIQPRYSDFRQYLSQSSVYLSHEQRKAFDKPLRSERSNKGYGAKTEGKETNEKKKTDRRIKNTCSTSNPKPASAPTAPNQGSKPCGNGGEGGDRKKKRYGPVALNEDYVEDEKVAFLFFRTLFVTGIFVATWKHSRNKRRKSYEEITWKDFAENYLTQGRVAKMEVIDENWLRVHTAPGASVDGAKTFRLRLDSLGAYKNVRNMAKTSEIKVQGKNKTSVVKKTKRRGSGYWPWVSTES